MRLTSTSTAFALLALGLLVCPSARADKDAPLQPQLAEQGTVVLTDTFDRRELGQGWAAAKGKWTIAEGVLIGKELAEDKHAAVVTARHKNRDSIVKFSFKLAGTKGLMLSLNHAKGHLFRIGVTPKALTITKDKDKKNPASKPEVLATAGGSFQQGKWYTMLVEIVGDKVHVQTDNNLSAMVQHAALDVDKTGYRFVMRGDHLEVDDLVVWNVVK